VRVVDPDGNTNHEVVDQIFCRVTSSSDLLGLNVALTETGTDTNVFEDSVSFTDQASSGTELRAKIGDTITAKYEDWTPALEDDFTPSEATNDKVSVTATARIGALLEFPVPTTAPTLVDSAGNEVATPRKGQLVIIQSTVTNEDIQDQTFTYIIQVKDARGTVVQLSWISDIKLGAGGSFKPGVSWTPQKSGDYTVEVFVWKSLDVPTPLSEPQSTSVTVT
jgi:hypothetical protein